MLKRLPLPLALTLILVGAFLLVLIHLFSLRFDAGDIYPAYSSLRADPLGTRALYESLDALPDVTAKRWLEPGAKAPKLKPEQGGTFLILGVPHRAVTHLGKDDVQVIEDYAKAGGRVIVTFNPISGTGWFDRLKDEREAEKTKEAEKKGRRRIKKQEKEEGEKSKDGQADSKQGEDSAKKNEDIKKKMKRARDKEERDFYVSLPERWGFKFKEATLPQNEKGEPEFVKASLNESNSISVLPQELPWHSSLQFQNLSNQWQTVYSWKKEAVLIARDWGKGQIVLCGDTYLLSNEALKLNRQTAYVSWLVGNAGEVYFDESHLGVVMDPGVATLICKYRLYGVVFALVILAALFIWKNSLSLVPPEEDLQTATVQVTGRDAGSGFLNLMYRSIKPKDLIRVAFEEWRRTARNLSGAKAAKVKEMQAVGMAGAQDHPVETYRQMAKIWKRKS